MPLTESLTINAILIGLLSSRERSSPTFVERGQTCTANGFNGDLESLSSSRLSVDHGPQTHHLKRPPIINAQIARCNLCYYLIQTLTSIRQVVWIPSLLIPSPFTVHNFTICQSFHLGHVKQFAYCPSGSGHSALLGPTLVYFNNINCAASMDMDA
jgi:hypothetical protein